MRVNRLVAVLACVSVVLSGCSMFDKKPSEDDIKKVIAENLPGFMEVFDIEIQAMENMGTKVEPKYHSRYVAKIKLLNPTYEKVDFIGGNVESDVVRLVLEQNTTFDAFGKAISVLDKEKWNTRVTDFEFAVENRGKLLGKYNRAVIEGSKEHETAKQKLKEWEEAKAEKMKRIAEGITGKWVGTYICGQGRTGLNLTISSSLNTLDAVFAFYPTKEKPQVEKGSFSLLGEVYENGTFKLKSHAWIDRPKGYGMVDVSGNINSDFTELVGKICSKGFLLRKQEIK